MRSRITYFLLILCSLCLPATLFAQKDVFKLAPKKDAVIIFKLVLCNRLDDEYCLASQEIWIRGKKYMLGGGTLYETLTSAQTDGSSPAQNASSKAVIDVYNANRGYSKVAGTRYFAQEVLATGNGWRRNKGGATFVLKTTDGYDWSNIYIAYKITGTFAMSSEALASCYDTLLTHQYHPNERVALAFPIVEVLNIESFSGLTKKEARRIGLHYQPLPYYRLKTAGLESLFDQTGKGQRDQ